MKKSPIKTNKRNIIELKKHDKIMFENLVFNNEFKRLAEKKSIVYLQLREKSQLEKDNTHFFKYMDLESAILSLRNNNLRFVEPTRWEDKFESRFYNADYSHVTSSSYETPFLYACCMSMKAHNEAAWKVYSYGKVGLGAHCVQFKINRNQFRKELIQSVNVEKESIIFEGLVTYTSETIIKNLHKKWYKTKSGKVLINTNHKSFFVPFDIMKYMNLLLLKRDYFQHENEIRFFVIPPKNLPKGKLSRNKGISVQGSALFVSIDWANVIEEIRIDSKCTDLEYSIFKDACLLLLKNSNRYIKTRTKRDKNKLEKMFTPIKTDIYGNRKRVTIE